VNPHRRQGEAAQRFAERRRREDEAPRLLQEVPRLRSLRLDIDEHTREGVVSSEPAHIRRIVVEHAPALFFLPCGDTRCRDGGHDVTRAVMAALRDGKTQFEGEDACSGTQGSGHCGRILHYIGMATFAE